jgi:uncharacterized membrane protein YqjE
MDRWDIVLLIIGALVAVGSLVRLMRARRDQLVGQVRRQLAEHRRRKAAADDSENAA